METLNKAILLTKNPAFKKLAEIADISALSKEDRIKYDESIKVYRDNLAVMAYARNEGEAKGWAAEKWEIALKMKEMGMPIEMICQITGLSAEEIREEKRMKR